MGRAVYPTFLEVHRPYATSTSKHSVSIRIGQRTGAAVLDLEPGLSHRVPVHISDLNVLEEALRKLQRCLQRT